MARYKKGASARDYDLFGHKLPFYSIHKGLVKAHAVSDETLRSEYTRLRDIAQKRLKRMAGRPEAAETFAQHAAGFPTLKSMTGTPAEIREQVVYALEDVANFLVARRGSMSGIQSTNRQIVQSLAVKGIIVNKEDLKRFGAFMNTMRKLYNLGKGIYGSDQFAELWSRLNESGNISQAQYEKEIKATLAEIGNDKPRIKAESRKLDASFFREEQLNPRTAKALKRKK